MNVFQSIPYAEIDDSAVAALVDLLNKWLKSSTFKASLLNHRYYS